MSAELPNELKKLADEFANIKKDAGDFLAKVKDSEFNKRPQNNGWSVAECYDHLVVIGFDYSNQIEAALQILREKNLKLNGTLKYSWFGERFINFVGPGRKLKAKSPKKWKPQANINKSKVTTAFLQLQDRWIELINKSAGFDLTKVKLPSPATKLIKFSAYEILGMNAAHQRRHMEQAKRVKNNL